ncbi:MAG: hypothetical protein J7K21_00350 [Desulfurococcales archaeon]|nr:hypothetical protein [Desulfurococcales archaeon]
MNSIISVYGRERELQETVEEYLRTRRDTVFKKQVYGRIIFYKLGFLKKITLIYYRSEGYEEIHGPADIINDMVTYLTNRGFKVLEGSVTMARAMTEQGYVVRRNNHNYLDTIGDLIIEAQIIKRKMILSKRAVYIIVLLAIPVPVLTIILELNLLVTLATILFLIIALFIPYPVSLITRKEGFFIPIRYTGYRDRFENLLKEIDFRIMLLPSKEREYIRKMIIDRNLRR